MSYILKHDFCPICKTQIVSRPVMILFWKVGWEIFCPHGLNYWDSGWHSLHIKLTDYVGDWLRNGYYSKIDAIHNRARYLWDLQFEKIAEQSSPIRLDLDLEV